jgi:hypothetical protein
MTVPDFASGLDTPTHVDETGAPLDAVSEGRAQLILL